MEKRGKSILFVILLVLIGVGIFFFASRLTNIYQNKILFHGNLSSIVIEESTLSAGTNVDLAKGSPVDFLIDDERYSLDLYSIKGNEVSLRLSGNGLLLVFYLQPGNKSRAELDSDGFYELEITFKSLTEKGALFYLKRPYEEKSIPEKLTQQLDYIQKQVDKTTVVQSLTVFSILLILFIFIFGYLIQSYFVPYMKRRKANARELPPAAMSSLLKEFRSTKDKRKRARLYAQARHLYNYLSDKDKKDVDSMMKSMESYIN